MFLTGPGVVAEVMGEDVTADELGGPRVHERNGVCHMTAPTEVDAALLVRDLLDHLPQNAERRAAALAGGCAPARRARTTPCPTTTRKVYDVARRRPALVDGGRLLEVSPRWARNVVCAFARIDGRAVGVVANQPRYLGGVLDADCAAEGRALRAHLQPVRPAARRPRRHARASCPARSRRSAGVIRHGAKLVHAFAEATVPRVTRDPAQGVRRRLHRDELQGARRRPRVRLARRADRRDGRRAGGRDHPPPRDRRAPTTRARARAPRRALRRRAPHRAGGGRRRPRRRDRRADRDARRASRRRWPAWRPRPGTRAPAGNLPL